MSVPFWFADTNNSVVRYVDASGIITTPALTSADSVYNNNGGFSTPWGCALDRNNGLFVVDNGSVAAPPNSCCVYRIDTATLVVTRVAGGGGGGAQAWVFSQIYEVAVDAAGNVYIADAGTAGTGHPNSALQIVCLNRQATTQNILGVSIPAGAMAVVAGNQTLGFSGDGGPAISAELSLPYGMVLDATGNLYFCDADPNHTCVVRKVNTSGIITTICGQPGSPGFSGDGGPASAAKLNQNSGITIDAAGNLYVVDTQNFCVRAINNQSSTQTLFGVSIGVGAIKTIAGQGGTPGYSGDGGGATAALLGYTGGSSPFGPWGAIPDGTGNLLIADTFNFRIRMVTSAGIISTIVGTGTNGYSGDGGPATSAKISQVYNIALGSIVRPPSCQIIT